MPPEQINQLHEEALAHRYDHLAERVHVDVSEMHEIKQKLGWT